MDPLRRQTGLARSAILQAMQDVFTERYGAVETRLTDNELAEARRRVDAKFGTGGMVEPGS